MTAVHTAEEILESLILDLRRHEEAMRTLRAGIDEVLKHYPELRRMKLDDSSPAVLCEECD